MRRSALLCIAVGFLTVALATWRAQTSASGTAQDGDLRAGGELFQNYCAACHGSDGSGLPGADVTAGPPIRDVDLVLVDLVLRTGRMPIASRPAGVPEKRLDDEERSAVVAWMQSRFDLPGRIPTVGSGDAGRGQETFVGHCAACHGGDAGGGITGSGQVAPSLKHLDGVALAEAARVGPFAMPPFSEQVLDDQELADVAAFVEEVSASSTTPLGLAEADQVVLGGFVLLVVLAAFAALAATIRAVEGRTEEGP